MKEANTNWSFFGSNGRHRAGIKTTWEIKGASRSVYQGCKQRTREAAKIRTFLRFLMAPARVDYMVLNTLIRLGLLVVLKN